jgi:hypothetical protein
MVGKAEFPTEEECQVAKDEDEEIALIMQNVEAGTYQIKEAGCTLNTKDYPSA